MRNIKWIGLSSVQHFLVDGLCICCMYLLTGVCDDYDESAYGFSRRATGCSSCRHCC